MTKDEKERRIATLKRVIRRATAADLTPMEKADIATLEKMITELGGQVRDVPYRKSKLRRLSTRLDDYAGDRQILDPDFVQDAIKRRDVAGEDDGTT